MRPSKRPPSKNRRSKNPTRNHPQSLLKALPKPRRFRFSELNHIRYISRSGSRLCYRFTTPCALLCCSPLRPAPALSAAPLPSVSTFHIALHVRLCSRRPAPGAGLPDRRESGAVVSPRSHRGIAAGAVAAAPRILGRWSGFGLVGDVAAAQRGLTSRGCAGTDLGPCARAQG